MIFTNNIYSFHRHLPFYEEKDEDVRMLCTERARIDVRGFPPGHPSSQASTYLLLVLMVGRNGPEVLKDHPSAA
jgi:hypothetical protein